MNLTQRRALMASIALLAATLIVTINTGMFSPETVSIGIPLPYKVGTLVSITLYVAAFLAPLAIHYELEYRAENAMRADVPKLLREVSALIRSGETLTRALALASARVTWRLRLVVNRFVQGVVGGIAPYEAYERASRGLPKDVRRMLYIFVEAYESGGRVGDVISLAADYSGRLRDFDSHRAAAMKPYLYVILVALVVFYIAAAFLLRLSATISGLPGLEAAMTIDPRAFRAAMYYSALEVSLFSGLLAGKIIRGKMVYGLTYSLIFLVIGTVVVLWGDRFIPL